MADLARKHGDLSRQKYPVIPLSTDEETPCTHSCLCWLYIAPPDTKRAMDRLLRDRDAALEADPSFSGMPQAFIDWTWQSWLPTNLSRYEKQVREHLDYLDRKIGGLNHELEQLACGVLDDRDAAAELRDCL